MKAILTTTLILVCLSINLSRVYSQCDLDDWTALKTLYNSTSGDNWTNNENWDQLLAGVSPPVGCDLSILFGIELDQNSRLSNIELSSNNLTGIIPAGLILASEIDTLALANNNLTGIIPVELSNLINLGQLHISQNQFIGSIPSEIDQLINLEDLRLHQNQLTGRIPFGIGKLTKLKILRLYENELSGNIPATIGDLTELEMLFLYTNKLTGIIPLEISNLNKLKWLSLKENYLSGPIPPGLSNLNVLEELHLNDNLLKGNIPSGLSSSTLKEIDLSNNLLSGSIPGGFENFDSLLLFNVGFNKLSGAVPFLKTKNPKITIILNNYFSCNDISGNFINNNDQDIYSFSPQNYQSKQVHLFNSEDDFLGAELTAPYEFDEVNNLAYQWQVNGANILSQVNPTLKIANLIDLNADQISFDLDINYQLQVTDKTCLEEYNKNIVFTSDTIYTTVYEANNEEIDAETLMVEFKDEIERTTYEETVLYPNGGEISAACNCNRELYLWNFKDSLRALENLVLINKKLKKLKRKNDLDGLNNITKLNPETSPIAFMDTVFFKSDVIEQEVSHPVNIFILDSGLDTIYQHSKFLYAEAPVDSCYGLEFKTPAYSYINSKNTINNQYHDLNGHGSFGFTLIAKDLPEDKSFKIVPLKVFDDDGKGNLFNLVCGIYHGVDHDANIINISAGYRGGHSFILENAIRYADEKQVFIITSSGNDGINIDEGQSQYPAAFSGFSYNLSMKDSTKTTRYNNVLSVAAIDYENKVCDFSNVGRETVTLATYGKNIVSNGLDDNETKLSGTSMATFLATYAMALQLGCDTSRNIDTVLKKFDEQFLEKLEVLEDKTISGKKINIKLKQKSKMSDQIYDLIKMDNCRQSDGFLAFSRQDSAFLFIENQHGNLLLDQNGNAVPIKNITYENTDIILNKWGCTNRNNEEAFTILGNPGNGKIVLHSKYQNNINKLFRVIDTTGKVVIEKRLSEALGDTIYLDLDSFPRGIYLIKLIDKEQISSQKFILH